ncbi:MAG: hypothetical protein Fur0041_14510 [Bacteroidia bacterium]
MEEKHYTPQFTDSSIYATNAALSDSVWKAEVKRQAQKIKSVYKEKTYWNFLLAGRSISVKV